MLKLKNITKDYSAGSTVVHALKGIDLKFRKSEFVSILGPSGCGKTTLLNIIGGLDQYTTGDLIIDGRSTRNYKNRDWDSYRNYSVGFVFQSYNLIPQQSVLQNVELALTLSGVSKSERRRRAKEALEAVGLGDQLKKKPKEMSGGQMQRVAIARALVNNPDIILADEPTGALDSETSIQVMEILKKVAKDRLVVMVTHNPDLAQKYSTRIIKMLDGIICEDSMPVEEEELKKLEAEDEEALKAFNKKIRKPSMKLGTSFSLSLKNLFAKKGRTFLTIFAGSIGIIGIALIYSVSYGMNTYIKDVQEDTLSSYPISIESSNVDISTLMETFMGVGNDNDHDHADDAVYKNSAIIEMINALNNIEATENDLHSFKKYVDDSLNDKESKLYKALSGVQYSYNLNLAVYTQNIDGTLTNCDSEKLLYQLIYENLGMDMESMMNFGESGAFSNLSSLSSMSQGGAALWTEMLPGLNGELINPIIKEQYDLIYGEWPDAYNEVILVLDSNNELDDLTLYALGLIPKSEIDKVFQSVVTGENTSTEVKSWSYEDICSTTFRVLLNSDCYLLDEDTGLYTSLSNKDAGLRYLYDNGIELKITGIIRPNKDAISAMLNGAIGYTTDLTRYVIAESADSEAILAQKNNPDIDIFTGNPFRESTSSLSDEDKASSLSSYINSLSVTGKSDMYISIMKIPSDEEMASMLEQAMSLLSSDDIKSSLTNILVYQVGMNGSDVENYLSSMNEEELENIMKQMLTQQVKDEYAAAVSESLSSYSPAQLAGMMDMLLASLSTEDSSHYYDEIMNFSESTYENNMSLLGCVELDTPSRISLYASSFENKDLIEDAIDDYNSGLDELSQIKYTDFVGLMMSSITTIINVITYVLIAFVSISLVVSSIMIGVITLISVQERTKEIGILRAIGASKRNVSTMFNAETIMIGLASGVFGVAVTYIMCIPINAIIHKISGIYIINATLPLITAVILIIISIILTLFAGIIPSRSAAKKDPVVALRSE